MPTDKPRYCIGVDRELLAATDWTQLADSQLDEEAQAAMRAYRQALRDIPQQEGFPLSVEWPEEPNL